MYHVYVLQSVKFNRFYIGVTGDIENRIKKHNNGSTKSTKPYRPWELIHFEKFDSKNDAYKREHYLKHPEGFLEKKKIIQENKRSLNHGEVA